MKEKIAICHVCCGITYRRTVRSKLESLYFDSDNIYYYILTDNKSYFKDINRKNLFIYEPEDFYKDYPHMEKYEKFLRTGTEDMYDYANKFLETGYKFPTSIQRLFFLISTQHSINNVCICDADSNINFKYIENNHFTFNEKNVIYNAVSQWSTHRDKENMGTIVDKLKDRGYSVTGENLRIYDAACRLFVFSDSIIKMKFFNLYDDIVKELYEKDERKLYYGWYCQNEEYILAPIYNAIGLKNPEGGMGSYVGLFTVKHNTHEDRFWMSNDIHYDSKNKLIKNKI